MNKIEEIQQQDKLVSLGMLSAGIAHEIQNPLNFVINFSKISDQLLDELQEAINRITDFIPRQESEEIITILTDLSDNLQKINHHGNRAIHTIRSILLYSRGKEDEFLPTHVQQLTKEFVWLSYHSMRANYKDFNLTLIENYETEIPVVKLIPQDYSRVVLNVMNNACYAVRKKQQTGDKDYRPTVTINLSISDQNLLLSIEDNGEGMTEEVKQKLFDAFFTTKPAGQGTGIGMSIVKKIIEEKHHGKIEFSSEVGCFTRFKFTIPIQL